jgi:hypothetical protein
LLIITAGQFLSSLIGAPSQFPRMMRVLLYRKRRWKLRTWLRRCEPDVFPHSGSELKRNLAHITQLRYGTINWFLKQSLLLQLLPQLYLQLLQCDLVHVAGCVPAVVSNPHPAKLRRLFTANTLRYSVHSVAFRRWEQWT